MVGQAGGHGQFPAPTTRQSVDSHRAQRGQRAGSWLTCRKKEPTVRSAPRGTAVRTANGGSNGPRKPPILSPATNPEPAATWPLIRAQPATCSAPTESLTASSHCAGRKFAPGGHEGRSAPAAKAKDDVNKIAAGAQAPVNDLLNFRCIRLKLEPPGAHRNGTTSWREHGDRGAMLPSVKASGAGSRPISERRLDEGQGPDRGGVGAQDSRA